MRARLPDRRGLRRTRRRQDVLRGVRRRRADAPAAAGLVDHPLPVLEDAGPLPGPPLPGRSPSTGAATAAPTGRRRADSYLAAEYAADALAVLDATGTERAVVVSLSRGASYALHLARRAARTGSSARSSSARPRRWRRSPPPRLPYVTALRGGPRQRRRLGQGQRRLLAAGLPRVPGLLLLAGLPRAALDQADRGRRRLGPRDHRGDAHRTRRRRSHPRSRRRASRRCSTSVRCPCLVIHGTEDAIVGPDAGPMLADALGSRARLVELDGSGHCAACPRPGEGQPAHPRVRRRRSTPARGDASRWTRGRSRPKRALYVSSPIGLGHARRDVGHRRRAAPAASRPGDRLAGPAPGHHGARGRGRAHPSGLAPRWRTSRATSRASAASTTCTASRRGGGWTRSSWPTSWSSTTSSSEEPYDLWIGDEAWELDYYLHENPEQKRAAYVWLTDFVGWLPMPDGGEREAS